MQSAMKVYVVTVQNVGPTIVRVFKSMNEAHTYANSMMNSANAVERKFKVEIFHAMMD